MITFRETISQWEEVADQPWRCSSPQWRTGGSLSLSGCINGGTRLHQQDCPGHRKSSVITQSSIPLACLCGENAPVITKGATYHVFCSNQEVALIQFCSCPQGEKVLIVPIGCLQSGWQPVLFPMAGTQSVFVTWLKEGLDEAGTGASA